MTTRAECRARRMRAGVPLALVAASLGACAEVESAAVEGYEPAHVEDVRGSDVKQVVFTREGAQRVRLETGTVTTRGGRKVVPYAALIYDPAGKTYVYTAVAPRTFLRNEVHVRDIRGSRALLAEGPPAGTAVVTTGAAEVYGAEHEIAGSH